MKMNNFTTTNLFSYDIQNICLTLALVPSLIEGLRVVQGLRGVPVFLYRYGMKN